MYNQMLSCTVSIRHPSINLNLKCIYHSTRTIIARVLLARFLVSQTVMLSLQKPTKKQLSVHKQYPKSHPNYDYYLLSYVRGSITAMMSVILSRRFTLSVWIVVTTG